MWRLERNIARCRIALSLAALIVLFCDAAAPSFNPWLRLQSDWLVDGSFSVSPEVALVMLCHLAYSLVVYATLQRRLVRSIRFLHATAWVDVAFGPLIALFTEGTNSPYFAFFVFSVVVISFRSGSREAIRMTAASVLLYLSLIVFGGTTDMDFYLMRPAYLAIIGYLLAHLGQHRRDAEAELAQLADIEQRTRVARDLHDGCVQTLAATNVSLKTCEELLRRDQAREAGALLATLQAGIRQEYDSLRQYMELLQRTEPGEIVGDPDTRVDLNFQLTAPAPLADHVLQIVREAVANLRHHSNASLGRVVVQTTNDAVTIDVQDDGVGFRDALQRPWSIASRVAELGGMLQVGSSTEGGARLDIRLPSL